MILRKKLLVPLLLALAGTTVTAHAADDDSRKDREERRVLRESEYTRENLSEEYRRLARQKRHEEMEFAKELLRSDRLQGETKAEMLLRLADLYFEEGRDIYLQEMEEFEKKYDACFEDEACNPENLKPDNSESRKWQLKSIKLYKQILASYPTFARADEATFYLGAALRDIGKDKEAVQTFTRLVKTYPDSEFVPDAYVQIGEYYFDHNNAYKALLAYQKAAAYRDSDKYPFALYKLAWCYYNVGEYGKAIDTMKSVVAYSMSARAEDEKTAKNNIQLKDEALRDLVRFFADAGEMEEAYAYFNKLGQQDLIRKMLKRLANTYFEQGKFEEAIQTYRRLIAEDPDSKYAPEYQAEIINCYDKMGKSRETVAEIDRMLKTYGKNSSWARKNASDPEAIKTAQELLEKNLRKVASDYHLKAKKLRSGKAAKEYYALAYKAYKVYLDEFPDSKYAYDMRYEFAELLYKIKRYDEAYEQYMKVVEIDPKGKHSKFCAESAIFAADEMIKRTGASKEAPGKTTEPIELTEWEKKLLAALDQYAKLFPDDKKTQQVIYRSAYLLYNRNHFKEASDRFRTVIAMNPGSKQAEQAANLILDTFTLVEDWENLREVAKAFYDQEGLGSPKFKKDVYGIYERASFKLIEVNLEKTGDKLAAAQGYMAFYKEFPDSDVADKALNNAAVYFYEEGRRAEAMEARLELIEKFPKSEFYTDNVAALGFAYEQMGDFPEAARWYEKLFSLDKSHKGAPSAIYSAALFRRAMGDWELAIKDFQQYMTAYPDQENAVQVALDVAGIYEDHEQWAKAAKVYKAFYTRRDTEGITPDQLLFARLHYGRCLEAMGRTTEALRHYRDSVAWYEKAAAGGAEFTVGHDFVAEMLFKQAEQAFQDYMAMRITGPKGRVSRKKEDAIIAQQVKDKGKALLEIEQVYAEIIKTGSGRWGLAALVRLGQAYENMGETFRTAYVPSYLNEDQRELYTMALEDQIYPQIEKAVQAYSSALAKAYELNLYNDDMAFASRRLSELRPDEYPPLVERLLDPGYPSEVRVDLPFATEL